MPKPVRFRLFSHQLGLVIDGPNSLGNRRKSTGASISRVGWGRACVSTPAGLGGPAWAGRGRPCASGQGTKREVYQKCPKNPSAGRAREGSGGAGRALRRSAASESAATSLRRLRLPTAPDPPPPRPAAPPAPPAPPPAGGRQARWGSPG